MADWNNEENHSNLRKHVAILLDESSTLDNLQNSLDLLVRFFEAVTGIKPHGDGMPSQVTQTSNGIAFYPDLAASCMRDTIRTVKYLRAVNQAIHDMQTQNPGERIHIFYAGTGPYAALVLPLCSQYQPDQIRITFLDIHRESAESVGRLLVSLGWQEYASQVLVGDAARFDRADQDPFHILVSENMQRGLTKEPQIAILLNLSSGLKEGGVLIPENHRLDLYWSASKYVVDLVTAKNLENLDVNQHIHLGSAFIFSKDTARKFQKKYQSMQESSGMEIEGTSIVLPVKNLEKPVISIVTKLILYNDIVLEYNESGITSHMSLPFGQHLGSGVHLHCNYVLGEDPGLKVQSKKV